MSAITPLQGDRIRERCQALQLPETELARRCGVTRQHIYSLIGGRYGCTLDLLVRIADELQCSTDYLLGRELS